MCLIVDASLASAVFTAQREDFTPILDWLDKGEGCLVFGGHLATELSRLDKPRRYIIALLRAGKARRIPDEEVTREKAAVSATGLCRSNDHHVVALARVSGARTLCTGDDDLMQDFKNPQLISKPRGKIYTKRVHAQLLRHTSSCGRLRSRRGK